MRKEHFYINSVDAGHRIHVISWTPDEAPRMVLQLVHGMTEYVDRYDEFARFLCNHGIAVIGHDHPGHGYSAVDETTGRELPGCQLGYYSDGDGMEVVLGNMIRVTHLVGQRFHDVPNIILGHSMGSFFLRRYLTMYSREVHGAIIMGTGAQPALLLKAGRMLAEAVKALRGRHYRSNLLYNLSNGAYQKVFKGEGRNAWLSRNTESVAQYNANPLCNTGFTASAYADFFRCMVEVATQCDMDDIRKDLPVLIVSGSEDPVGGSKAARTVEKHLNKYNINNVSVLTYEGMRHEVLQETGREQVFSDILKWLQDNI